jgi:hypothetical protein
LAGDIYIAIGDLDFQRLIANGFNANRFDLLPNPCRRIGRASPMFPSIRPKTVTIRNMALGMPVPNASPDLIEKVEAAPRSRGEQAIVRRGPRRSEVPAVGDLRSQRSGSLLTWDQATYMQYGGAASRGRQSAMLRRFAHERFVDPALGRLVDRLEPCADKLPADDASLTRVVRRWHNPPPLILDQSDRDYWFRCFFTSARINASPVHGLSTFNPST